MKEELSSSGAEVVPGKSGHLPRRRRRSIVAHHRPGLGWDSDGFPVHLLSPRWRESGFSPNQFFERGQRDEVTLNHLFEVMPNTHAP